MNTCKMFILGVDFPTASLPRIPSHVVFSLYFGLAVSSTMGSAFLDQVVQDRDCIQSLFVELSSGFAVNQALSASARKCSTQVLGSNKENIGNVVLFDVVSHNSNNSTLPNSRIISFDSLLNGL